ncbi:MAG: PAS domain S-box protein [Polaromonas sp.]
MSSHSEPLESSLSASHHLTHALATNSHEGFAVIDRDLRFVLWNPCLEELTGMAANDVLGQHVLDLFPSFLGQEICSNLKLALSGKTISAAAALRLTRGRARVVHSNETHVLNEEQLVWAIQAYAPWRGANGAIDGVIVVISDLTERVRAKKQLNDTRVRSQAVIDHMLDGMAMVSSDGKIESFNKAAERLFGYRADEVIGQNVGLLLNCPFPCRQGCKLRNCPITGEHGAAGISREVLGLRKDESIFPLELVVSKIQLRGRHLFTALLRDISPRKNAEEELRLMTERLHQLAAHQESVREAERTRIAHELHDELGGLLTAAKFEVNQLGQVPGISHECIEKLRDSLDAAIRSTRTIIADLRPPVIDLLGLWGAIEWHAKELAMRRGLACQVDIAPELEDLNLAHDVNIALFRIVQEALGNVAKHAEASAIIVRARPIGTALIEVEVIDNGKGLNRQDLAKAGHWGIMGMRERVRSYGGSLALDGTPGGGTTLRARLRID